jgi:hypothetical protein
MVKVWVNGIEDYCVSVVGSISDKVVCAMSDFVMF